MFEIGHVALSEFERKVYAYEQYLEESAISLDASTILLIDDDPDILTAGRLLLARQGARVETCADPGQIPVHMAEQQFQAFLLDMNFGPGESSGEQGLYWLGRILERDPDAVVVLMTAHGGVDIAVEAMKLGATDFVAKPWQNEKLIATLSASVKLRQSRDEASSLQRTKTALVAAANQPGQPMLGGSGPMQAVHSLIARTAPTDANVLILGENGTGKELVARELHRQSRRAEEVFMSVDLGAIAESLFEAELFGHSKGAFTDARSARPGRMQGANRGSLFLDEIGNLPLHLQAKLLTVLEQRQVSPLGSDQSVAVDIRVIAATNLPREQLHDEQRFRQDLLFRLNTVEIELPPLRERRGDIPEIAEYYVESYCRKYGIAPRRLSADAAAALSAWHWPGNVRALRHAVERAVILSEQPDLQPADFQLSNPVAVQPVVPPRPATGSDRDFNLARRERETIAQALSEHEWNISRAARALGLTRAALYRRMEKHGL